MTAPTIRAVPDPEVVRRQNELFDLYSQWPGDGDPDDDPDFVDAARKIMGLPALGQPSAIRSSAPGEPHRYTHGWHLIGVRPALADAKDLAEITAATHAELERITGHRSDTSIHLNGLRPTVAREYAEGLLRAQEAFPKVPLKSVMTVGPGSSGLVPADRFDPNWFAFTGGGTDHGHIMLSTYRTEPELRDAMSQNLAEHYSVSGDPTGTAIHEFGHLLVDDPQTRREMVQVVTDHAMTAAEDPEPYAMRHISVNAGATLDELGAEAFADVMLNGRTADPLSHALVDVMRAGYERLNGGPESVRSSAPHPGQRYRHGWIPIAPSFDERAGAASTGEAALAAAAPRRALSGAQREAIGQYGIDTSYNINAALREHGGDLTKLRRPEKHRPIVEALDSAMEPLTSDIVVYRNLHGAHVFGDGTPGDQLTGDLTDRVFTDPGFVSTSATERRRASMVMRILVPKGTPAISGHELEPDEIVLGRGQTYRVVADHGRPGGTIRQLDVEVVHPTVEDGLAP